MLITIINGLNGVWCLIYVHLNIMLYVYCTMLFSLLYYVMSSNAAYHVLII